MPRKRKANKRKSVRRRRVGATALNANNPMVKLGSVAAGFLLGDKINGAIDTALPDDKVGQKTKGLIEGGLGAALVFMKMGRKKTTIEVVAGGILAGAGARRLLKEFGIITGMGGYDSVPVVARRHHQLNGYGSVPVIAGGNGGYKTSQYALKGALNGIGGYQVPLAAGSSNVMGSVGQGGSECMQ